MKITMWTDYVCPYSYIGTTELFRAIAEQNLPIEIDKKAYLLHPENPIKNPPTIWESFLEEDGSEAEARKHLLDLEHLAKEGNVELNLPDALCPNTMAPHRLTYFASMKLDQAALRMLIEKIYRAGFVENKSVADHTLLEQIATECGLNPEQVRSLLNSDEYAEVILADCREGDELLEVIPYFRAENGTVLTGAITPAKLEQFLQELGF